MRFPYLFKMETENCKKTQKTWTWKPSAPTYHARPEKTTSKIYAWSLRNLIHNFFGGKMVFPVSPEATPETM